MKKLFTSLAILTLSLQPLSLFAAASGSVIIDPTNLVQNTISAVQAPISSAYEAISSASNLAIKTKDFSLDIVATKIAQDMINRAAGDTVTWINSGFQGEGPGFIVNPEAYLKNVANQEIRIQLDAVQKSTIDPFKNAVSVAIVKNVRDGRSSIAAQMQYTLTDTVRSETCNDSTLQRIAESQVNQGLSAGSAGNASLSKSEQVEKRKGELYQEFCTAGAKSNPQAQLKLQACYKSGACGGWGSLADSFNPKNTEYGRIAMARSNLEKKLALQVETAKNEVGDGIIPEKVCQVRLQVDEMDNPYPPGEGPCVEWNTKTPVSSIKNELYKSQTGEYSKLKSADELGEVIGNALLNQATKSLYTGLNTAIKKAGIGSLNVTFDNLLVNKSRGLPSDIIKTENPDDESLPIVNQADVARASAFCANIPSAKKAELVSLCQHLASNNKAQPIDTRFREAVRTFSTSLSALDSCIRDSKTVNPPPGKLSEWEENSDKRREAFANVDVDALNKRTDLYPRSISTLSTYITSIASGTDAGRASIILNGYGQNMADTDKFVPLAQEALSSVEASSFRNQVASDENRLSGELSSCTSYLNRCRAFASEDKDCDGRPNNGNGDDSGGGGGGGDGGGA
jgi:hypothetical protein